MIERVLVCMLQIPAPDPAESMSHTPAGLLLQHPAHLYVSPAIRLARLRHLTLVCMPYCDTASAVSVSSPL